MGMQREPIVFGPLDHALVIRRVRVNPHDHFSEVGIAIAKGGGVFCDVMDRSVNRIKVTIESTTDQTVDPSRRSIFQAARKDRLAMSKPASTSVGICLTDASDHSTHTFSDGFVPERLPHIATC
jgi:hypothetical protein